MHEETVISSKKDTTLKRKSPPKESRKITSTKTIKFKEEQKQNEIIEEDELNENIPPPYDKYYDESWFPKDIGFDTSAVTVALLEKIHNSEAFVIRDILSSIADIHR